MTAAMRDRPMLWGYIVGVALGVTVGYALCHHFEAALARAQGFRAGYAECADRVNNATDGVGEMPTSRDTLGMRR